MCIYGLKSKYTSIPILGYLVYRYLYTYIYVYIWLKFQVYKHTDTLYLVYRYSILSMPILYTSYSDIGYGGFGVSFWGHVLILNQMNIYIHISTQSQHGVPLR